MAVNGPSRWVEMAFSTITCAIQQPDASRPCLQVPTQTPPWWPVSGPSQGPKYLLKCLLSCSAHLVPGPKFLGVVWLHVYPGTESRAGVGQVIAFLSLAQHLTLFPALGISMRFLTTGVENIRQQPWVWVLRSTANLRTGGSSVLGGGEGSVGSWDGPAGRGGLPSDRRAVAAVPSAQRSRSKQCALFSAANPWTCFSGFIEQHRSHTAFFIWRDLLAKNARPQGRTNPKSVVRLLVTKCPDPSWDSPQEITPGSPSLSGTCLAHRRCPQKELRVLASRTVH